MNASDKNINSGFIIKDEIILSDPEIITIFKSEGKQEILRILITQEMNLHDLRKKLEMNPGTVKRHLDQLLEYKLIEQTREDTNSWGVKMKYYRSVAKRFIIHYSWPD